MDSVHSGLSYHFNNVTICIFDDEKFVNCYELTAFELQSRAQKIFEFHLARWATNSQLLLVRGTYPLVQVFKLINNS